MIDAHHHLWRLARGDYGWLTPDLPPLYRDFEPEDLTPILAAVGVTGTVLVQAAPTETETDHLLRIADAWPTVRAVVGWTDFTAEVAPTRIERLAARSKLAGLRPMIQDEPDLAWMLRADVGRALTAMASVGLRLDALVRPQHLSVLSQLVDRHPDLPVVIDHAAKPDIAADGFAAWAGGIKALSRRPHVFCKLSGLLTEAGTRTGDADLGPYVDHLLDSFGPGRLMWGSDWPVLLLASDYAGWLGQSRRLVAALSADEQSSIFQGAATAFYGLETTA